MIMQIRLKFMLWLYGWSQDLYTNLFKRNQNAWGISKSELSLFPEETLGRALGEFYQINGFDVMPKLENHDIFHVITQTGTEIQDEIAMQYLLLGNGKRSLYMFSMILIGTLLYPEFLGYYQAHFKKGKRMNSFHQVEFKDYLDSHLQSVKAKFMYKNQLFL